MAKRWVGDPTTGHWVDDNGNPTTAGGAVAGASKGVGKAPPSGDPNGEYFGFDPGVPGSPGSNPGYNPDLYNPSTQPTNPLNPNPSLANSDPYRSLSTPSANNPTGGSNGLGAGVGAAVGTTPETEARNLGQKLWDFYGQGQATAQGFYNGYDDFTKNLPANQPKNVGNFYDQHEGDVGPTQNRDQYRDTKNFVNGQVNPVADAYNTNKTYYNNPSHIDENAGAMQTYGTSDTNTQGRYDQRLAQGSPTYDANRYDTRLSLGGPTALTDRYSQRQQDTAPEYASDLLGELAGTKSAADGLMIDPEKTQAIGDLYSNVLMPQESGPGYAENWYTSTLNGANPYYDRLRQQTGADAERRAAASGTFNAGRSQKLQNDAIAGLDAQQFKDQGALAAAADSSKDSRLQGLTTGAKTYEDTVLGNRNYNLGVANSIDAMTSKNNALRGDLATSADNTNLKFGEDIDSLAGKTNDSWFKQQEDLDSLAHNASGENLDQTKALDALSTSADASNVSKLNTYNTFLNNQDAAAQGKAKDRMTAAGAVDASNEQWQRDLANQANNASQEESGNRDFLEKAAHDASNEALANLDQQSRAMLAGAAARAGVQLSYDTLKGGALSSAEMQAINIELQKAGMDAAKAQATVDNIFGGIGTGLKAAKFASDFFGGGGSTGTGSNSNVANPNGYFLGDDG